MIGFEGVSAEQTAKDAVAGLGVARSSVQGKMPLEAESEVRREHPAADRRRHRRRPPPVTDLSSRISGRMR